MPTAGVTVTDPSTELDSVADAESVPVALEGSDATSGQVEDASGGWAHPIAHVEAAA